MGFSAAVKTCLKKYATFSGRASRSEYWWFMLFAVLLNGLAITADGILGTGRIFNSIAQMQIFFPFLAVTIRRLHDSNRTGWWVALPCAVAVFGLSLIGPDPGQILLLGLAVIGLTYLAIFVVMGLIPGDIIENAYGPPPGVSPAWPW